LNNRYKDNFINCDKMNKFKIAEQFSKSLFYPGIEKVILFGSVARHEDKKDSNIEHSYHFNQ